jgi:hypothetical protein
MQRRLTYWNFVSGVLLVEICIGVFDAQLLWHAHINRGEVWAWFFIFIANWPVSIFPGKLLLLVSPVFSDSTLGFLGELVASFLAYVFVGTLWWSTLLWLIAQFYRFILRFSRR